jgi:choline dehydrogenase
LRRLTATSTAASAYLHPVEDRPNLEIRTRSLVTKVHFDGNRAVGVDVVHGRRQERIDAGEVLLCGGAFNSPQLLQLSGVGNAAELGALGVAPVHDLPAVGENLQDHLEVYIQYSSKLPVSVAPAMKMRNRPWVGAAWLLGRRGPGATNHFEGGGFIRSNEEVAYPNLMYHFLPVAIRYDGTAPQGHGYQVHVGPMYSDARGSVKINSTDPRKHPAIRFNYLSTDTDRREWIEAVQISRRILTQPAFDDFNGGELSPGPSVESDQEILDWVAKDAETALHPSCTCRLGVGEDSVVDPTTMKVHGLEGVRVVDASSLRYVTNGNIYAPTMMLAEKSVDLILGNTPLEPIDEPFYRHQKAESAPAPTRAAP